MREMLRRDADVIIREAIQKVLPDEAVAQALQGTWMAGEGFGAKGQNSESSFDSANGKIYLVAIGKAAWQMAKAATDILGDRIEQGIVVTKYGHVKGPLANIACYEAGHPVP